MHTIHSMEDIDMNVPHTMKAAALRHYGGPEQLALAELPVPAIDADEILIHVKSAGLGVWDPLEREGKLQELMNVPPHFPYILGSDGAGAVAAVGKDVSRFKPNDIVYGIEFMNPKGGFYAEYAAIKADNASLVPANVSLSQAGAMPVDAMTALRGLDDTLAVEPGESVIIFGASGGVGHMAVQLAKRMGAHVLAIASGDDGVELANRLGADASVDGKRGNVSAAIRSFAPTGVDAALLANGKGIGPILAAVRDGGRVAYPHGVEPDQKPRGNIRMDAYDGDPDPAAIEKLNQLIESGPFEVYIQRTFTLGEAAAAHRALNEHHLGKFALLPVQ
jgi:NADPH:quinone reductase-like Zn-dependent oxidoreductase